MSNEKNIRVVLGSERFVGGQDNDVSVPLPLLSDQRTMIEGDRNVVLNLAEQFTREREESTTYRVYGKIDVLFNNAISGHTSVSEIVDNMYYYPPRVGCTSLPCNGVPPFYVFDPIPPQALTSIGTYVEPDAYQDTWVLYTSYVFSSTTTEAMQYRREYTSGEGIDFIASDGIPFHHTTITENGKTYFRLTCPVAHGLSVGEYIELPGTSTIFGGAILLTLQTNSLLGGPQTVTRVKVDSLGDGTVGSESNIINFNAEKFTVPAQDSLGTFKRLINLADGEAASEYYVHLHKLLSGPKDYVLDKAAFERGIYGKKAIFFKSDKTPPGFGSHIGVKLEYNPYIFNFTNDIDVSLISDNLNRPVLDLYVTVFNTNMYGLWKYSASQTPTNYGWDWNVRSGTIDPILSSQSSNIQQQVQNGINFPNSGATITGLGGNVFRGAFVEYNKSEVKERVISEISHTMKYNSNYFTNTSVGAFYHYQPHNRIPIRKLSNIVVENPKMDTSPNYASYSLTDQMWKWRYVLDIDYIEEGNNGVGYPFSNDVHYPYRNIEFLIKPNILGRTGTTINIVGLPTNVCE